MCCNRSYRPALRGQAALIGVLVLLLLAALLILAVGRFTVSAVKVTEADYRAKEAQGAAEAGVSYGIGYLHANRTRVNATGAGGWMVTGGVRWSPCSGTDVTLPCGDGRQALYGTETLKYANVANLVQPAGGASYTLHYLTPAAGGAPANAPAVTVIAEGLSADRTARAVVRQGVRAYGLLKTIPPAPLISGGSVGLGGNLNIWTNPDGRGTGLALSVWTPGVVTLDGGARSCGGTHPSCPPVLSNKGSMGADLLAGDPGFPADLFDYFFDTTVGGVEAFRAGVTNLGDCSSMPAQSAGVYWIAGDCAITSTGGDVGSVANPVILIVDGAFRLSGNVTVTGVVYARGAIDLQLTGGPVLHGTLVAEPGIATAAGTFDIVYQRTVIENASKLGGGYVRLPATWNDAP